MKLEDLPQGHYGAILADPPWRFEAWGEPTEVAHGVPGYPTLHWREIAELPVGTLAAEDSCLFLWMVWSQMPEALEIIKAWGYQFKTCAFSWIKADTKQIELFRDDADVFCGMGYWTRANSEVCLLATRGQPKRLNADVRQAIIEPRREHSRKPDCVYSRIERLVAGPYLELFARTTRLGWTSWGNETTKFREPMT